MASLSKSLLLFMMNWLDAQLTILWVRLNIAEEGNTVMARLLEMGEGPFLAVKLIMGAFAAYVLYRSAHLPMARRGMRVVLTVYGVLMLVHVITAVVALGWHAPAVVLAYFSGLPAALVGLLS